MRKYIWTAIILLAVITHTGSNEVDYIYTKSETYITSASEDRDYVLKQSEEINRKTKAILEKLPD